MELAGRVIAVLEPKGGTSRNGNEWKVQEYVIETHDQYPRRMCFDVFGDDKIKQFNIQVGNDVPHKIYFSQYTGGKPDNNNENRLNIERNNLYRFRVKCTGYDYTLTLAVQNWFGTYENIFEYGDGQVVSPVAPWDDEINNDYEF